MQAEQVFKALADKSRLDIYRLLLERPAYVEVISERLKLAPSTVSFHLKKLAAAGLLQQHRDQYYNVYSADPKFSEIKLGALVAAHEIDSSRHDKAEEIYRERVLKSFFKYGKLQKIPVQKKKKEIVLRRIAESFSPGKTYSEIEVNQLLNEVYPDVSTLRRELVGAGLFKRESSRYQKVV